MRQTFYFLLAFFPHLLFGQTYQGDIFLTTQADVDKFLITYPGIKKVNGQMLVGAVDTLLLSNITDLAPLAQLEEVSTLYVSNNGLLASLNGLQNLDTLGYIYVYNNPSLATLTGLDGLKYAYSCSIRRDSQLTDLTGLNNLIQTEGLYIDNNKNLISLKGLDKFRDAYTYGTFITNNPKLKSLSGMNALQEFNDFTAVGIGIYNNDALEELTEFPKLGRVFFSLKDNKTLKGLSALNKANFSYFRSYVGNNDQFYTFDGLGKVTDGTIGVENNAILQTVNLGDSLLYGNIGIAGPSINAVHFPKTKNVHQLLIRDCPQLKTLENFLPNVDSVDFKIEVWNNDSLHTIHEDFGPRFVWDFYVHDNKLLEYITGFEGMEETGPALYPPDYSQNCDCYLRFISNNFTEISGFNSLTKGGLYVGNGKEDSMSVPHFKTVEGFNANGADFHTVHTASIPQEWLPRKLIGFQNANNVSFHLEPVALDTFSAFRHLKLLGDADDILPNFSLAFIGLLPSCKADTTSFGELALINYGTLWNAGGSSYMFRLPNLANAYFADIVTSTDLDSTLIGIYPKLKTLKNFVVTDCSKMKSLHGIEHFTDFKQQPIWSHPPFLSIYDNDSLTDCSALCYIFDHATFYPPNYPKAEIDNPLFPCNDLATVLAYCDTLTDPVHETPKGANPAISLFPNPESSGLLNIRLPEPLDKRLNIAVADASGRTVLQGAVVFSAGLGSIRTDMLPVGWYQLTVDPMGKKVSAAFLRQ